MGFLRLYLAIVVVVYHAKALSLFPFIDQTTAVLSFFVISGFYMAMIWDGKYHAKIGFYINRCLRIFPIYWIALSLMVLLGLIKSSIQGGETENALLHFLKYSEHLHGLTFFSETFNFIIRNITLIITKDYFGVARNLAPGYLIISQAWSLQIELLFYLLVPLILKFSKDFLLLTLIYFLIFYGIIVQFQFFPGRSLTYDFFSYLIYFLIGICSYKYIYLKIKEKKLPRYSNIFITLFFLFLIFFQLIPFINFENENQQFIKIIFFISFAGFISFLFHSTRTNRIDRYVGELSYPVFITHELFIKGFNAVNLFSIPMVNSLVIILSTLLFAVLLVRFVQNPIDRFRHRFRQ